VNLANVDHLEKQPL